MQLDQSRSRETGGREGQGNQPQTAAVAGDVRGEGGDQRLHLHARGLPSVCDRRKENEPLPPARATIGLGRLAAEKLNRRKNPGAIERRAMGR